MLNSLHSGRSRERDREGNGTPLQYFCLEKSHGRRSLVGCSPWGCEESDTTEQLHFHFSLSCIGEGNGNPLQCSFLENPRDGEACWAAVYGVAQSRTRLKRLSSSSSSSIAKDESRTLHCMCCVSSVSFLTSTLWKIMGKLFCRVPQFGFSDAS